MTCPRGLTFTALLLMSAVQLLANAGQPHVIIDDPPPCNSSTATKITTLSFTFTADGSGGSAAPLCFENDSTALWYFVEVDVPAPDPPSVHIYPDSNIYSFKVRQWIAEDGGYATIDFFNTSHLVGIGIGTDFTIDIGTTGWTPGGLFQVFANEMDENEPTPEPMTVLLLAAGLAPVLSRWRSRLR